MDHGSAPIEKYHSLYGDLRFERSALFELIRKRYNPSEVLYPGCSIHLTPAFYFPHVCFVDRSPEAAEFFSNQEMLLDYISRKRTYRRRPYIQFIEQDFTEPLPVQRNQFDLLLALFTGGVSKACKSYLKTGGFILTNDHQGDAVDAANDQELRLIAIIRKRQDKYRLEELEPGKHLMIKGQANKSKQYLRQTSGGLEYVDNESYYLFRRDRPGR